MTFFNKLKQTFKSKPAPQEEIEDDWSEEQKELA